MQWDRIRKILICIIQVVNAEGGRCRQASVEILGTEDEQKKMGTDKEVQLLDKLSIFDKVA